MFKKTITWTDFNEVEQTTELYFHLSKLELGEFQQALPGWQERFQNAVANNSVSTGMSVCKDLVRFAVGKKSDDGSRFIKTPEVQNEIMDSPAVEELIYGFVVDPQTMLEFITALLPKEVRNEFTKNITANPDLAALVPTPVVEEDTRPAWEKENRRPTPKEFASMTPEEQKATYAKIFGA